jgi:hypothetical protein
LVKGLASRGAKELNRHRLGAEVAFHRVINRDGLVELTTLPALPESHHESHDALRFLTESRRRAVTH